MSFWFHVWLKYCKWRCQKANTRCIGCLRQRNHNVHVQWEQTLSSDTSNIQMWLCQRNFQSLCNKNVFSTMGTYMYNGTSFRNMCAIKYVRASALASFIRFPAYWNRITFRWFLFYTHYYKHETWSLCTWIELRLFNRNQRNEVFTLITAQNRDNFINNGFFICG